MSDTPSKYTKHKRNTEAVVALAHKKSEETLKKVDQAIRLLIKNKERINFNTVATTAQVSKSFLYNNKQVRERIEFLRNQQEQVKSPKAIKRNMSNESKDATIEILRERIKKLEAENKRLKEDNKRLLGIKYSEL